MGSRSMQKKWKWKPHSNNQPFIVSLIRKDQSEYSVLHVCQKELCEFYWKEEPTTDNHPSRQIKLIAFNNVMLFKSFHTSTYTTHHSNQNRKIYIRESAMCVDFLYLLYCCSCIRYLYEMAQNAFHYMLRIFIVYTHCILAKKKKEERTQTDWM